MTTLMYFLNIELVAGSSTVGALSFELYTNARQAKDIDNDDIALVHARYYGHDRQ